jgi:hypothetical protein
VEFCRKRIILVGLFLKGNRILLQRIYEVDVTCLFSTVLTDAYSTVLKWPSKRGSLEWAAALYSPDLTPLFSMGTPVDGMGYLMIILVDASNGIVKDMRQIGLPQTHTFHISSLPKSVQKAIGRAGTLEEQSL